MTAVVFEFNKFLSKASSEKLEKADVISVGREAEVIIFPGVRQERLESDETETPQPKRGKKKA